VAGDARMRFEDYVVGPANEAAVSAARAVADAPGLTHNPLLIHGASGVGKSHLLSAIANALAPGVTVEYLSVDAFGDLWRAAEASGDAEQFLDRLSHLDVLLLDDLQTIAEPPGVQEQLVRLIAERDAAGRQLVVASDRPLRDISGLDDALSVRLASGVVVQLASAGDASAGGATGLGDSLDFQSFLTDIASAVAEHVEGWKMRVALARVILKDAPILVLDEATSALDSEVEAAIQEQLDMLMEGRTVIAIAHRLSTIRRADQILVVEEGRIIERGTHDELYAVHGRYWDLYTRQHGLQSNLFLAPGEGDTIPEDDNKAEAKNADLSFSQALREVR